MFEPVSPSGTGKTLSALISSTCASRLATAARTAVDEAGAVAGEADHLGGRPAASAGAARGIRAAAGRPRLAWWNGPAGEPRDVDPDGADLALERAPQARSGSPSRPGGRPRRRGAR